MHFTGTKFSPMILLLLRHKTSLVRMEAFFKKLIQCFTTEKQSNQINK